MWRTACRPKWLAVLALALAIASLCAWLGNWQWDRAHEKAPAASEITSKPVRDLASVLVPQQQLTGAALATPVRLQGEISISQAVLVGPKTVNGASGQWVVAPILVRQPDGSTARLPVVLGWTASNTLPQLTTATVSSLEGVLQQPDPLGLPPSGKQYSGLSTAQLAGAWGTPIYTAYLIPTNYVLPTLTAVAVPPPPRSSLALQNLSYAVQWFLFAAFAVFIWYRMVRDDYLDQVPGSASTAPASAPSHP